MLWARANTTSCNRFTIPQSSSPALPLKSPRLNKAFAAAKSFSTDVDSLGSQLKHLPLADFVHSEGFDREQLEDRESVWRLRRGSALSDKKERVRKRFGRNSDRGKEEVSIVVFRR